MYQVCVLLVGAYHQLIAQLASPSYSYSRMGCDSMRAPIRCLPLIYKR